MSNALIQNLSLLHTTPMGATRIQKNCELKEEPIAWCKQIIQNPKAIILLQGKNWYVTLYPYQITVNATSYTVITAHQIK